MYEPIQTLSGITSLLCAGLLGIIVLTSRIQEGPIIKLGLILMTMGLLASGLITLKGFDTMYGLWNASLMLRIGLLVALLGYRWKMNSKQKELK